MRRILFILLILSIPALLLASEPVREWKNAIGKTILEASLDVTRDSDPETVYLIKEGKRYKVSFKKLSQADQEYVIKARKGSRGLDDNDDLDEVLENVNSRGMAVVPAGRQYALLIGVNAYATPIKSLRFCVDDMKLLADCFQKLGMPKDNIFLVTDDSPIDRRPTGVNIRRQIENITQSMAPDDQLIVAFSGHGVMEDGKSYLCPSDTDLKNRNSFVSRDWVFEQLEKCKAKQKVFIIDACRDEITIGGEKALGQAKTLEDPIGANTHGFILMASCDKNQQSWEHPAFQHGVFTHFLVEGLSGAAKDGDGYVTVMGLFQYSSSKTKKFVMNELNMTQVPTFRQGDEMTDFCLARLTTSLPPIQHPTGGDYNHFGANAEPPLPPPIIQPGSSELLKVNGVGFPFRYCPPGTFIMGSPESEEGRNANETQHHVTLTKGFWIMQTEVTQKQWKAVMGNNPSHFKDDHFPVEMVSLKDCQDFCEKCSRFGLSAQLPTEAQWEYACRAGSQTAYFWGNDLNGDKANCNGTQPCGTTTKGDFLKETTFVSSYQANSWGLYDMNGNVSEWCADCYVSYPTFGVTDPFGGTYKKTFCIRGGNWSSSACDCRSAFRNQNVPDYCSDDVGFRIVISEQTMEEYKKNKKEQKSEQITEQPKVRKDVLIEPPLTWSMNSIQIAWTAGSDRKVGYIYGIDPTDKESLNIIQSDKTTKYGVIYKNNYNPLSLFGIAGSKVSASFYIEGEFNYYSHKSYSAIQWSEVEKTFVDQVLSSAFRKNDSEQRLILTIDFVNHTDSRLNLSSFSANTIPVYCGNDQIGAARLISNAMSIAATGKPIPIQFEMVLNSKGKQLLSNKRPRIHMEDSQLKIQSLSTASKRIEDAIQESTASASFFTVAILVGNEVKEWKIRWIKENPVTLRQALEAINEKVCENNNNNVPIFDIKGESIASVCRVSFTEIDSSNWIAELNANGHKVDNLNSCLSKTPGRGERYVFQLVSQEIKTLQKNRNARNAKATFELSKRYDNGDGVPEDKVMALSYLQNAAEFGSAEAQYSLGLCYNCGRGVKEDKIEAAKWFLGSANQGIAEAQYSLGNCYYNGIGVVQDKAEAVRWYREAAEQEFVSAQYSLGNCYYNGIGVFQDRTEAVKWYRKAAEKGVAQAQYKLGECYYNGIGAFQDKAEAVKWYRTAAEKGVVQAQYKLGECYAKGYGISENKAEAVKWYLKAAEKGVVLAQNNLGNCYFNGVGVRQDYKEAVKWYRKAAEQGEATAQYNLGMCYSKGDGVPRNQAEAVEWYRKAAEKGVAQAQYKLGVCYAGGIGVRSDKATAVYWYRKAAEHGDPNSQYILGLYLEQGVDVPEDKTEAIKWYQKAAEQGNVKAQICLGKCYYVGVGVPIDKAKAKYWYSQAARRGNRDAIMALRTLDFNETQLLDFNELLDLND